MLPDPPCGHPREQFEADGYRRRCGRCGSFFDGDFLGAEFAYDERYPEHRGHFDARTGEMKQRTLARWLERAGVAIEGRVVCETGFGGAHTLLHLAGLARRTFGVEAVEANLARARELGAGEVWHFDARPERLPEPVDLWLFLDSFEHLPAPDAFLDWLEASSAPEARVLLVAPEAGSPTERLLGRAWPHKIPDHAFHWSRRGLLEIFERHGFELERGFHPGKYVSGAMVAAHVGHKVPALSLPAPWLDRLSGLRAYFNLGQMGLCLRRRPRADAGAEAPPL